MRLAILLALQESPMLGLTEDELLGRVDELLALTDTEFRRRALVVRAGRQN
jgi:hypothetical protein